MHVSTAKLTVAALAVVTASAGMVFAAVAPASATAGETVTSYNQACRAVSVGQTVDQVVPTSVTANHVTVNATPGVNPYTLQPGFSDDTQQFWRLGCSHSSAFVSSG